MKLQTISFDSEGAQVLIAPGDALILSLSVKEYDKQITAGMRERGSIDWNGEIAKSINDIKEKVRKINQVFDLDQTQTFKPVEVWLTAKEINLLRASVEAFRKRRNPAVEISDASKLIHDHSTTDKYLRFFNTLSERVRNSTKSQDLREQLKHK